MSKALLQRALAYVRWQAFGDCRTEGWEGPPPTAFDLDAALVAAIAQPVQPVEQDQRKLNGLTLAVWACAKPNAGATPEQMRDLLAQCVPYLRAATPNIAQPVQPASKLLTPGQIEALIEDVFDTDDASLILFARAVEAAHGIGEPL